MIITRTVCAIIFVGAFWRTASSAQDSPATPSAPSSASAATGDETIHLHMPVRHRARHAAVPPAAPAENASIDAIGADPDSTTPLPALSASQSGPPPPEHKAPPAQQKPAQKAQQQSAPAIPFNFGEDSGSIPPPPPQKPPPKAAALPPKPATPKETTVPPSAPQTKTVSLSPKPAPTNRAAGPARKSDDEHAGLAKRGAILFAKGVPDPSPAQFTGVKLLAGEIANALEAGASRVQLEAYGGTPGDKSSDARRLALKRALAVRQLLIDNGVPSNRIDVRALGGADDKGPDDRVDVFLRTS